MAKHISVQKSSGRYLSLNFSVVRPTCDLKSDVEILECYFGKVFRFFEILMMMVSTFKILTTIVIMMTMMISTIAMMMMLVSTCSGELVVKVRLCAEMMAEPPGLTSKPDRGQDCSLFLVSVLDKACVAKDLDMENKLKSNNSEI